jgi:HSP20 family molecular chaperone IbpA
MADELQTQKQEAEIVEGAERTRASRVYIPQVDIFSAGDDIVILADMPGVAEEDIDITLEKDVLTINGYVSNVEDPEGYELLHGEYGIGDYQRSFTLPDEVDRDNIEASLSHGVLRLTLPKAPQAQTRKITVKTA